MKNEIEKTFFFANTIGRMVPLFFMFLLFVLIRFLSSKQCCGTVAMKNGQKMAQIMFLGDYAMNNVWTKGAQTDEPGPRDICCMTY